LVGYFGVGVGGIICLAGGDWVVDFGDFPVFGDCDFAAGKKGSGYYAG
jgi:hypothetical protein